jgi:hypothetical protein
LYDDLEKDGGGVLAKGDESAFEGPKAGEVVRQHSERAIGGSKTMKKSLQKCAGKGKCQKLTPNGKSQLRRRIRNDADWKSNWSGRSLRC